MSRNTDPSVFIGTMTGTSMDGMDIAAVSFDNHNQPQLIAHDRVDYPDQLREELQQLATDNDATVSQMCRLDTWLGQFYAEQINRFIATSRLDNKDIAAIGSHGQTVRHSVDSRLPYTLQIGDPNIIAALTGLTVVADFRRRDLALGGQGAPLAPAFHNQVFRSDQFNRIIINIGGIANITALPADPETAITGFDTGPGNTLMDYLSQQILGKRFDDNGNFARSGTILSELLNSILQQEPYFSQNTPKSTGTDYFSPLWLRRSGLLEVNPADAMTTLAELVSISMTDAIKELEIKVDECYVCGGGAHNGYLMQRIAHHLPDCAIDTTASLGLHPDWVEAVAFAWLARQTMGRRPGNQPSVTNAQKFTILGAVYY